MDWVSLIAALMEMFGPLLEQWLEDCLEPTEKGVKTLRRFGPMMQLSVARAARKAAKDAGLSPRGVGRQAVQDLRADIDAATDAELMQMLQGVREVVHEQSAS